MVNKFNHHSRKMLNFKTPHAVFFAESLQEKKPHEYQDCASELNSPVFSFLFLNVSYAQYEALEY